MRIQLENKTTKKTNVSYNSAILNCKLTIMRGQTSALGSDLLMTRATRKAARLRSQLFGEH